MKNQREKNIAASISEEEFSVAEEEAQIHGIGTYVHKFKKPFEYMGKTYDELTFEWDTLTGEDGLAIERELQMMGIPLVDPKFSGEYLIRFAAKACTEPIGSDALRLMPIAEFNRIRNTARSFLIRSESL